MACSGRLARWGSSIVLLLVCVAFSTCRCNGASERAGSDAVRLTEPRLSGFGVWHPCTNERPSPEAIVAQSRCGTPTVPDDLVSMVDGDCDRPIRTMRNAVRVLAHAPRCTDAAVATLEDLANAQPDAEVLSNLAAGYYLRAQRKDRPSDFVRALDAADRAVALNATPAARFNQALAEEALGLSIEARDSWDALRRTTNDGWQNEATDRWTRLQRERNTAAATQWPLNEQRLPDVARTGDEKTIEALIDPYRAGAQRYVEETVLVAWAEAAERGDETAAEQQLRLAEMIARVLARITKDDYLRDVVDHIRRSSEAKRDTIRTGIAAYRKGRDAERKFAKEAAAAYARAEQAFTAADNPFQLMARIKRIALLSITGEFPEAERLLAATEAEATRARYRSILGRVHTGRGFMEMMHGRFLDSVMAYGDGERMFTEIGDTELACNTITRAFAVYRVIGNLDLTWREIFKAHGCAAGILEAQSNHVLFGESAAAALDLGHPQIALRYQNRAIALLQQSLRENANDDVSASHLITNLGIAYRARAAIYAHLGDERSAERDLAEAESRTNKLPPTEAAIAYGFRARLAEAEAQTLQSRKRYEEAIAALTRGVDYAARTHFSSLRASLLVQRADVHAAMGNRDGELADLHAAVQALRLEEQAMLSATQPVRAFEEMWSAYFARYQKTYRRLIQRLVERGEDAASFDYSEKARAFEPLHRILARHDVPESFRARIRDGEPFRLSDVQQSLPDGTFLIQYAVLDDQTFVWVIWNRDFHRTVLPYGNARIQQWTTALQRFGRDAEFERFHDLLAVPYDALLREPLARVSKIHGDRGIPRIVIVPDRAMHGLPFAALRDGQRHVVHDFIVSVAASATLYAFSLEKDRQRAATPLTSALIVADPAFDRRMEIARNLGRLGWARTEATRIEELYDDLIRVQPLRDTDATAAEFMRLARNSSIIHVAAHGIANSDIPSRSFLLFARSGVDSGAVDADRLIRSLQLDHARLVVLAACSSAGGTPVGPEGLAPLVRPLVVAGAPGVVGTLWNVTENSETVELLVRFHRHYRNGRDAEDALRHAQLEMLGDPELGRSSAVAWAPFQAVGHASSPFQQETRR